jgi:hypothetical protein
MKVYVSHTQKDSPLARKVVSALRESGFDAWASTDEFLLGENWFERHAQALKESEAMVVLLTPAALASPWVEQEILYALGQASYAHRVIPVFVGDRKQIPEDEIPWILKHLKGVNLPEPDKDNQGFAQIALALKQVA